MIEQPTVFILGAGASAPYGFPTGDQLRLEICRDFPGRIERLARAYYDKDISKKELKDEAEKFTNTFSKSGIPSIDLFLARNQQFAEIGKMAIVESILRAENQSHFLEDMEDSNLDWYSYLYRRMTERYTHPGGHIGIENNRVSFITFNYDRSLEHFLYRSLSNSFTSAPKDEIAALIKRIPIFHVYGKIDQLPWEANDPKRATTYRTQFTYDFIKRMKGNIKIMYETRREANITMLDLIGSASRVFFLGFGYAKENLEAIQILEVLEGQQRIYGTAYKMLKNEIEKIRNILNRNFRNRDPALNNPYIINCDCLKLLRMYL